MLTPYVSRLRRASSATDVRAAGRISVRRRSRYEPTALESGLAGWESPVTDPFSEDDAAAAAAEMPGHPLPPGRIAGRGLDRVPTPAAPAAPAATEPDGVEQGAQPRPVIEPVGVRERSGEGVASTAEHSSPPAAAKGPARRSPPMSDAAIPPSSPMRPRQEPAQGESQLGERATFSSWRHPASTARDADGSPPRPAELRRGTASDPDAALVARGDSTVTAELPRSGVAAPLPILARAPERPSLPHQPAREDRQPLPEVLAPLIARAARLASRAPSAARRLAVDDLTAAARSEVSVTIERLEVRAQPAAAEREAQPRAPRRRPSSLDEYLRARTTGRGG